MATVGLGFGILGGASNIMTHADYEEKMSRQMYAMQGLGGAYLSNEPKKEEPNLLLLLCDEDEAANV